MIIGRSFNFSSKEAISKGSLSPSSFTGTKGGAPSDSCSARAPIMRAFSYFVNQGGPILIENSVDTAPREKMRIKTFLFKW